MASMRSALPAMSDDANFMRDIMFIEVLFTKRILLLAQSARSAESCLFSPILSFCASRCRGLETINSRTHLIHRRVFLHAHNFLPVALFTHGKVGFRLIPREQHIEPVFLLFSRHCIFMSSTISKDFTQCIKVTEPSQRRRHQEMALAEFIPVREHDHPSAK